MKIVSAYSDGMFCWIDLMTSDLEEAKRFYSGVFGWEMADRPMPNGFYTMATIEGHTVAGMGQMPAEMAESGVPSNWTSYVKTSDIGELTAKVVAAGGEVTMRPDEVPGQGKLAIYLDPCGAVFGAWEPITHIGAELVNHANTLVWNELSGNQLDGAIAFYESILGWVHHTDDSGYTVFSLNGRVQSGLVPVPPQAGEIPPNWGVFILVDRVEETAKAIEAHGGRFILPPTPAGQMGVRAVAQDPQGGIFTIMHFNGQVDPPPGH